MWKKIYWILFSFFSTGIINISAAEERGLSVISNPLADSKINSLEDLFVVIIDGVVFVATPLIVLAFIYAGFKFVSAQGDSTKIGEAKSMFIGTIVATLIILSAQLIIEIIVNTSSDLLNF